MSLPTQTAADLNTAWAMLFDYQMPLIWRISAAEWLETLAIDARKALVDQRESEGRGE